MTITKQTFSSLLLPVPAGDNWVQIFPAGTTTGRDGRGPYTLTNAEAVVTASIDTQVDMVIDRDHATDLAAQGAAVPAAGWIKELRAQEGAIFAHIEWTPPATEQLKNREYRYISPTFLHDSEGRVTRILRASLTNNPNFEMKALASADALLPETNKETSMEQLMNDLAALLELEGENISPEAIMEGVRQLKTSVDAVKEATDAPEEAATPEQLVEAVTDYVEDEVKKEVASRMQKATASADPSKFVPIEVLKQVQQQVASLVASEKETKATAAVDAAVKAGKIIPAQRDWAKSYASADLKGFESYVAGAPVIVASGGATGATIATASANGGLDAEHAAIAKQLGVSAETFKANLKK